MLECAQESYLECWYDVNLEASFKPFEKNFEARLKLVYKIVLYHTYAEVIAGSVKGHWASDANMQKIYA